MLRFMGRALLALIFLCATAAIFQVIHATDQREAEERLSFQTHVAWSPRINLNADVAMVMASIHRCLEESRHGDSTTTLSRL